MINQVIDGNIIASENDLLNTKYIDLHLQSIRNLHVAIEVIDENNKTIDTIQGLSIGGSMNTSNSSLIRRTGDLSFILTERLIPRKQSLLWMNNKIRVYVGIEDLSSPSRAIAYFLMGTFYISEPSMSVATESSVITINLEDNMMKWEQKQLENKLIFEPDTPLNTAVTSLMHKYNEWNIDVELTDLKIPYTLEFSEDSTVLSVIETLRGLYMDWECFYKKDGTFVFRKMNIQREDGEPSSWIFDSNKNLITNFAQDFTYKNVKNKVVVIGQMDEKTGITPRAEAKITNEDSIFHENEVGIKSQVIVDSSYATNKQCESRAMFELFKASTFQEKLNINTIPIYLLSANDIIEVENFITNEIEKYIIDTISVGLGVDGDMNINGHKLYYNYFDVEGSLEQYRESVEIITNGINNKGWLSLSEDIVSEYLGMDGSGSNLYIEFEYDGKHGTTAYTTGYFGTKNQTLTIDLADFENVTGDSGNNGNGKAEYSDRILGHEMVHVVMNDFLGVTKTTNIPPWFKEGLSEFVHGADERLKSIIIKDGVLNVEAKNSIISRAIEVLNGGIWTSTSSDYVVGYVIVKYLDKKLINGKDMKNIMWSIKDSEKNGEQALKDSIVSCVGYADYQEFISDVSNNLSSYINTIQLNLDGDEVDTGSICGSSHRGLYNLNAEDIFDNSKAIAGQPSKEFKVIFKEF